MNAMLTINVRVVGRNAVTQLNQIAAATNGVSTAAGRGGSQAKQMLGFFDALRSNRMINAGKNLQWVGRQLTFNFTLPLVAAGAALNKFNLDVQRSMTEVKKVYGDFSFTTERVKEETDALARSFELLSTRFGIHQKQVVDIAAAWASAGSAGRGLAENVRSTLEAMILGEMEATEATEGLIAIQSTWRLSTKKNATGMSQMTEALAQLNIIENQTGIRFKGLVDVMARAGGVARTSGMSIRELGSFAAALVPATGSAAQAGNALKTIISRLQAPTQDTIDVLKMMGITVASPEWLGKTATEKIISMSDEFANLSTANKNLVSSVIASRWQVNKFNVLMDDIASGTGYFAKAMEASSDQVRANKQYQQELLTVLESNPRKWDIMTNAIRNSMAKAFLPLMPVIMTVIQTIAKLAGSFSKLPESTQRIILLGLAILALIGPLGQLAGALMQLGGLIGVVFKAFALLGNKLVTPIIKAVTYMVARVPGLIFRMVSTVITQLGVMMSGVAAALGIPVWALVGIIAAVVLAIVLILNEDFRDRVWDIIKDVGRAFAALPRIVANAFNAMIRVIGRAIEVIVEQLSYLNPFARHSPSLVDQVQAGVATILNEYSKFAHIPALISSAVAALDEFGKVSNPQVASFREYDLNEIGNKVKVANPAASGAVDNMIDQIMRLEAELPELTREIAAQSLVVGHWEVELDQATRVLDAAEDRLASATDAFDAVSDAIDEARDKIRDLADTPIAGMAAMEDQIFANEQAQNLLNMRLLEFEKLGYTIDSIRDRYALLNGEIEVLQGQRQDLANAGAGSDVLKTFDDQIAAIRSQRTELGSTEEQIRDIQAQLESLDLEKRFLELTKSITFDPLLRQLDQMTNKVVEMPFDEIVRQIQEQQAIIAALQPQYDALAATVEREQAAVDAAKSARDAISAQLDAEQIRLDGLENSYRSINELISQMESSMRGFAEAAEKAAADAAEISRLEELFDAGLGVDFPIEGGDTTLGAEGMLADIEQFNKDLEAELQAVLENMGGIDIFAPLKEGWNRFVGWLKTVPGLLRDNWLKVLLVAVPLLIAVSLGAFAGPMAGLVVVAIAAAIAALGALLMRYGPTIWNWAWEHIIKPIGNALQGAGEFFVNVWNDYVWPVIAALVQGFQTYLVAPMVAIWQAVAAVISWVWTEVIAPVITTAWGIIQPIFQAIVDFIQHFILPIFELFGAIAEIIFVSIARLAEWLWNNALSIVFTAIKFYIFDYLIPAFQFWWGVVQTVFKLVGDAAGWMWNNVVRPIWVAIKSYIDNVLAPTFHWLHDNVIKPVFDAIGVAIKWAWDNVINPTFTAIKSAIDNYLIPAFNTLKSTLKTIWSGIIAIVGNAWNTIAGIVEGGANMFVSAFNAIARGVNAIAGFLRIDVHVGEMARVSVPRMDFSSDIPETGGGGGGGGGGAARYMAAGGTIGREGGAVAGARALVGEGSNTWPEYVIPTDPRYRGRAAGLYGDLGGRLGQVAREDTVGRHRNEIGGWGPVGWAVDQGTKAIGAVGGVLKKGALAATWGPLKWLMDQAAGQIPVEFMRNAAHGIIEEVNNWVMGANMAWETKAKTQTAEPPPQGKGSWRVIPAFLDSLGVPYKILSTYRPMAITRFTGKPSWHSMDRAIDLSGPQWMSHPQMLAINEAIYQGYKPFLHELIYGGPGARNVFEGSDHTYSSALINEHKNHVHASLAQGGSFRVPRRPGGTLINVGEGRNAEKLQVIPLRGEGGEGGNTYNFYGDLEFPNVRDGSDAQEFLANLEALVKE